VDGEERQVGETEDVAGLEVIATTAETFELDGAAVDKHERVMPLGLVVITAATGCNGDDPEHER
jgi:hypothetical protein